MSNRTDVLYGALQLLVLQTLSSFGSLHGYALTRAIQRSSADALRVEEGSLYPALRRMEQQGWLSADWGTTDKGRQARFYEITPAGRKQLARERETWLRTTEGVRRVLRYV
ncbi:MAG: PadR family transcriptional regulator [Gemmatimonadetes bacterium]|nr:PadR family transcriptional regulator [Gemmatimonadota bacterium]